MAASLAEITTWYDRGVKMGATHMVIVCDTYDWEDYPVYVMPDENVREVADAHDGTNMQRLMEVYNFSISREEQLVGGTRVWNY